MFGFHDRLLTLRKAVYSFLTSHPSRAALRRRWQWQLAVQNAEAGLIYSKEEWDREWEGILKLATPQPRLVYYEIESKRIIVLVANCKIRILVNILDTFYS